MHHPARTWADLRAVVKEDFKRHDRRLSTPGFQALAVQRFGALLSHPNSPVAPLVRTVLFVAYRIAFVLIRNFYGIEIYHDTPIGRRLLIGHQHGIAVHRYASIGDDCHINHGVSLGQGTSGGPDQVPTVGSRVFIGPGSVLIGGITVGDDVTIGPGSLVYTDVKSGSTVFQAPSRILTLGSSARRPLPNADAAESAS